MAQVYDREGVLQPDLWACESCYRIFKYTSEEGIEKTKEEYRRIFGEEATEEDTMQLCDGCYERAMNMYKGKEIAQ